MKRLRELFVVTLAILIASSFFAEYAVTASAPGLFDKISESVGASGVNSERPQRVDSRPAPVEIPAAVDAAVVDSPVASVPAKSDSLIPEAQDQPSNVLTSSLLRNLPDAGFKPIEDFQPPVPDGNYCDPAFIGRDLVFTQTSQLTLDELLEQIHNRYGVNFLMGPGLRRLPINIKTGSIPWNVLLRSQLFVSGVRARCVTTNTIELVQNTDLPKLQDGAELSARFVKLKFLQRTSGGTVDLAGRSSSQGGQGGCGASGLGFGTAGGGGGGSQLSETAAQQGSTRFDTLIVEIEKILGIRSMTESSAFGNQGGSQAGNFQTEEMRTNRFVTQVPGRNILFIRATEEEHRLIDQIIAKADRPPFQVVIKGLVYSANQDRLYDIGVQSSILGGNPAIGDNPHGTILGHTLGAAGTLFDFSAILGTFDFNVQATAFEQNGVISIKARPFATVLDGLCTTLEVGRQLPIVIDSSLGGIGTVTFVDASNNLAVTPYVVDDENGKPIAVSLELRLAANDVDSSVTTRGVPAIAKRSVQTQLLLGEDKTAILGGFTVDQDSKTLYKTPGLGDIPIIGYLFKRRVRDTRVNRLYFAISVSVIPYGEAIEPVKVPETSTDPPSVTPAQFDRSQKGTPAQVVAKPDPTDITTNKVTKPKPDH